MYLVKTPKWLKLLYPGLVWNLNRHSRDIYLTFDDGPIPIVTPFVLKTLEEFNARATFFCIGDNIVKHPDIFEAVKAAGHTIGNHTFNHLRGWKTPTDVYAQNYSQCQQYTQGQWFRPPHGRIKRQQVRALQQLKPEIKIAMWDVLSGDFDVKLSPEACLQNVLKHTKPGALVVFHDSLKAQARMQYALPRALAYWSQAGYQFKSL